MSFDYERKRTPQEIVKALLMCYDESCEGYPFYEVDAPRGYSPCHELHMDSNERTVQKQTIKYCFRTMEG